MTTATTVMTCTPAQREFIRRLLCQTELPTRQVTVMHRDLFDKAGIAWVDGADMNATLRAVSKPAAHRLIDAIRERT
jgi:hypothetical protein